MVNRQKQKGTRREYEMRDWYRKARDEENRKRVRESMRNFQQTFSPTNVYGDNNLPTFGQVNKAEEQTVSPSFLTELR